MSEVDVLFACVDDMLKVTVDLFSAGTAGAGVTTYAVDTFSGFCSDVDVLLKFVKLFL